MKYSNYLSLKNYSAAKYNSLNNLVNSKLIKDRMNEKLTTINSDIDELYKKYQLAKQERIDKEKSQKNLVNRINFLVDEEKKMSKKCEIQLRKINNLKKMNSNIHKNNLTQKSPVSRKKTYDFVNHSTENVSNRKKIKNYIIQNKNNKITTPDKNDNELEENSNTNITNNICIIINNNKNKNKNKENYNIHSNNISKTINSEIGINNKIRYKKNKKIIKSSFQNKSNKSAFLTESKKTETLNKNNTPKFKQPITNDKNSQNMDNNDMEKSQEIQLNKSQDILVIKANQGFYFRNINNSNYINKNNKNKNLEENKDESNNSFLCRTTTNKKQRHFELKKPRIDEKRNDSDVALTENYLHANKTLTFNKIIEFKKKFLGINSIDSSNAKEEINNSAKKEIPKKNSNENKQVVKSYKEEKTKFNSRIRKQNELNNTTKTIIYNKLNIKSALKNNVKKKEKPKPVVTEKQTTGNLLKNLDIINNKNKKNEEEITNSYKFLIKPKKVTRRKKNISIDTENYDLENHPKTIITQNENCDKVLINPDKRIIKIIRKIQEPKDFRNEEEISKSTINNSPKEDKNKKEKKIEKEKTNIIIPKNEIETLRRINNKIENYKKNYQRNLLRRRNLHRNLHYKANSETKRKRFYSKSHYSSIGSFSDVRKNILDGKNKRKSSYSIKSHKFKK